MTTRKKMPPMAVIPAKLHSFRKRWTIDSSEEERWREFKDRFMNSYAELLGMHFVTWAESEEEFHRIIGVHRRANTHENPLDWSAERRLVGSSSVYNLMLTTTSTPTFVLQVQSLFWITALNEAVKEQLRVRLVEDIQASGVPIGVSGKGGKVVLHRAGALELDEAVVSEVLLWLDGIPTARDRFVVALQLYGKPGHVRDVADNLRRALEETLRHVLGNTKSLENQQAGLGAYLKQRGIAPEVAASYWKLVDLYSKFQNERVKHGDKVLEHEVELVLYLTGTFIRFLLTISN